VTAKRGLSITALQPDVSGNGFLFVAGEGVARRRGVYFRSTSRRDIPGDDASSEARGPRPPLFFLLKSLICIGLVLFALGWPDVETPSAPSRQRASVSSPQPPRRPPLQDSARDLAQAGADALIAAARDKCLSSPRDCAALLQTLGPEKRER
jgi:hypothetical protein